MNFNTDKGDILSIWIECLNLDIIHEQKSGGGAAAPPPGSGVPDLAFEESSSYTVLVVDPTELGLLWKGETLSKKKFIYHTWESTSN